MNVSASLTILISGEHSSPCWGARPQRLAKSRPSGGCSLHGACGRTSLRSLYPHLAALPSLPLQGGIDPLRRGELRSPVFKSSQKDTETVNYCWGARHLPCRRCGCVSCRPRPLAPLPASAIRQRSGRSLSTVNSFDIGLVFAYNGRQMTQKGAFYG